MDISSACIFNGCNSGYVPGCRVCIVEESDSEQSVDNASRGTYSVGDEQPVPCCVQEEGASAKRMCCVPGVGANLCCVLGAEARLCGVLDTGTPAIGECCIPGAGAQCVASQARAPAASASRRKRSKHWRPDLEFSSFIIKSGWYQFAMHFSKLLTFAKLPGV
ncbi:hypothetical protein BGX38DRAFT_1262693 [Terfezia claveryi]|nr:hypothetical protein BGX38DRAFT_1262693 [Terfezia claveryi]